MAASQWVVEGTMENFQQVVVDGSRERPIVIDFWAPWCGPCRALAPLLEKLANEKAGEFLLVKINTDENPDLAQMFQVEGIPAVFAVRDGQVVNNFTGLLPEEQLRAFIDDLSAEAPAPAEPTPLDQAVELEAHDRGAAGNAYRAMLATAPDDPAARVGLARVLLSAPGNEPQAIPLLSGVDFGDFATEAQRLKAIIYLREVPHADADLAAAQTAPTAEAKVALARILAARSDYTGAMDELLAAADDDRQLGRTAVRDLMLKVFEVIGPRSPQTDDYRKRLQSRLY
ncbi:thioredoxin : Thioredoxin OS=Maricaulis maris (strain MCS10) GN=Mmar10_2938 PE=4 SV=1: Thioredoxin: TPR_20 [Gemmata massiliana]|uniref:Thioredoxin n=1 Tax=Gemmata massiliana TaxID=1210884 RepID=A0A6P2D302_9BACT|nr:thioredoxin [Gemmata massiliana]VTR95519.1 thioredoxin : Thioredoxin OS=Maricaulis maris (strain MCS10) GN=Mmar10_2938 PE=4 SV=1: Thioredoxin: TPR_20 [Gemmata massiliana]